MLEHFQSLVNGLAQSLGLEYDASDFSEKHYMIDDSPLDVCYVPESDQMLLKRPLLTIPPETRDSALKDIFQESFFFAHMSGSVINLDDDGQASLQCLFPLNRLDALDVAQFVENFLNLADYWTERLTELQSKPSDTVSGSDLLTMLNMRV